MAKLYWRIKRNGKWTWVAFTPENSMWDEHTLPHYIGPEDRGFASLGDDDPVDKPEVYTDDES